MKTATLWFFYYNAPATTDVTGTAAFAAPLGEWTASGDVVPRVVPLSGGASRYGRVHGRPIPPYTAPVPVTIAGVGAFTAPVGAFNGVGAVTLSQRVRRQEFVLGLREIDEQTNHTGRGVIAA